MKAMHRSLTYVTLLLSVTLPACAGGDDAEEELAADTAAAVPAAVQPPPELQTRIDELVGLWNGEDVGAVAAYFAEDATVVDDTLTFTGREAIQQQWITPALPALSNLQVSDRTFEAAGESWTARGRFSYDLTAEGAPPKMSGNYEETWTRGADGVWYVKAMTIRNDPPPTTSGQ